MYVCICHGVTDAAIRQAAAAGASPEEIARRTGAGTSCGGCATMLAELAAPATAPKRCERTGGACTGCRSHGH